MKKAHFFAALMFCALLSAAFAKGTPDQLFSAIEQNDVQGVKKLIKAGVDVNGAGKYTVTRNGQESKEAYNGTALMLAIEKKNDVEIIKLLLQAGADVNAKDNYGRTALMHAAAAISFCSAETVRLLLQACRKADCSPMVRQKPPADPVANRIAMPQRG